MLASVDNVIAALFVAFMTGAVATAILMQAASGLGLIDVPGGRKEHGRPVPLVGGLAIFVGLLAAAFAVGLASSAAYFLLTLSIIIAVGLWDDVREISPRLK